MTNNTTYVSEQDTPSSYNYSYDDEGVPQREFTDFIVTAGDERISICALDDSRQVNRTVIARGTITISGKPPLKIKSAPLKEWCIEYGTTSPKLWIRTADVWYRLSKPSKEYARTHELARRRFELCSRIYILAHTMAPDQCHFDNFVSLLSNAYGTMKGYSEKEILSERDFILSQVKNLDDPNLVNCYFTKELREKKVPAKKGSSKKGASGTSGTSHSASVAYLGAWVPSGKLDADGNTRLLSRSQKYVQQISKHKNGWPFREPVNPKKDGVPDYFERIQNPMDFRTMKERFERGGYSSSLEVAKDVRLIASNCREYNGDDHNMAQWASELERKFENLIRGGEEAETVAMNKRASSKKRKSSGQLPPSGKGVGKKSASKSARKSGKTSSAEASPSRESSVKDEEPTIRKQCARSSSQECEKAQVAGSKYCSEECGLAVAKKRIAELSKAGYSVDEYIKASMTKALVHSRS